MQDPTWKHSGATNRGRDGCRVPIPWCGEQPPFGFSPPDASAAPWLPQPASWRSQTAAAQAGDDASMLALYRRALRIRRARPELGDGRLEWLDAPDGALAFARGEGFVCIVNMSSRPPSPPERARALLSSGRLTEDGRVPTDTTAWFAR